MRPGKLYNLTLDPAGDPNASEMASRPRIGILRKRTGVPVFLIYLKEVDRPTFRYFPSYEGIVAEMERSTLPSDKEAWGSLLPFFFAEGREAFVSAVPFSGEWTLKALIGKDGGLKRRTGIHSLKTFADQADLVAIPQVARFLALPELVEYYRLLDLELSPLEHFFFVLDLPCHSDAALRPELSSLNFPDAAIFHPWLVMERGFFPPSALVCAEIQKVDSHEGIQMIPVNRKLAGPLRPVAIFSPPQTAQFNQARVNVVQCFAKVNKNGTPGEDLRLWGGKTLAAPGDPHSGFIASRRLLLALKEAIEEIVAPFVMEPLTANLPHVAEVQLLSVLRRYDHLFDPDAREPYRVSVTKRVEKGDDILDIDFSYRIPYAVDEFNFSIGLTG